MTSDDAPTSIQLTVAVPNRVIRSTLSHWIAERDIPTFGLARRLALTSEARASKRR